MRPKIFSILAVVLLAALFHSCKPGAELPPPNIVWITSEDNSVHYMDLYTEGGAPTPHIEALAEHGILFSNAFSNGPVCSVARSTLMSGCYAPRIGANYHRREKLVPMPGGLEMFPAYLRSAGYYTTNNSKEDYNIIKGDSVWDESSRTAHWQNRAEGQPFFHVFNIVTTHESRLHFTEDQMQDYTPVTDTTSFSLFPIHPRTALFTYTNAFYRDKIMEMDRQAGQVVAELEEAGLLENTFIFYFGDHGGVLPGSKGYLYETGLHVPLVVHVPDNYRHLTDNEKGSSVNGFVRFVDFGPTVLHLAGVDIPKAMDGVPFLGKGINSSEVNKRDEAYGYADRMDEKYDMVRSYRHGRYKYIRSYQPYQFDGLMTNYRHIMLANQQWLERFKKGKLTPLQARFFNRRPPEMLFDLHNDPLETRNLAGDHAYSEILTGMRNGLDHWIKSMPDLSFYPEHVLVEQAFDDPAAFGRDHIEEIVSYIGLANLQLLKFSDAKSGILSGLGSEDPRARYWALVVCSSFATPDRELVQVAREITATDPELLNRVRAAEYLGLIGIDSPVKTMTDALYASVNGTEALQIFNSIVLMQDGEPGYVFELDPERINEEVRNHLQVSRRLEYLIKN
ncbi:MAG: sulfatase [Bacteroidales bacterium]|nr:sulfatase [Bacteroidales bacterium]MDT8430447.1 sulfatase [Bacteroidales bacterium]